MVLPYVPVTLREEHEYDNFIVCRVESGRHSRIEDLVSTEITIILYSVLSCWYLLMLRCVSLGQWYLRDGNTINRACSEEGVSRTMV